jgi:NADPH-dependent curcumin reductase CurA
MLPLGVEKWQAIFELFGPLHGNLAGVARTSEAAADPEVSVMVPVEHPTHSAPATSHTAERGRRAARIVKPPTFIGRIVSHPRTLSIIATVEEPDPTSDLPVACGTYGSRRPPTKGRNHMDAVNHQIRLAARPVGLPKPSDWSHTEEPIPAPGEGQVLVKVLYVSLDPAMRGWMNDARSYIAPVGVGDVMRTLVAGRVVASNHPRLAVGDYVTGMLGAQEYAVVNGDGLVKIDPSLAPLPTYLGTLGMPGMTAYFGLLDIGRPAAGETVVVSGAAGAVGGVVGQIAKLKGARAIGIAGGAEKCEYVVKELGFDAAIDYKTQDMREALREHCRKGTDVYFDNVGGEILDAALARLARHARVVICGAISQYNAIEPKGPANYLSLLVNHATMTGFVVSDYGDRYLDGAREMAGWLAEGKLVSREDIVTGGLERFPETFLRLFEGKNIGKLVLAVAEDD